MSEQLRLTPDLPGRESKTLAVLVDANGEWVSGNDFIRAYVTSYSQSIGKLIRKFGYPIERAPRDGGVQRYRLTSRFPAKV